MNTPQDHVVDALERALEDARSGRLVAFGFAAVGEDEFVFCYSFDDDRADQQKALISVIAELFAEIASPPELPA